MVQKGFLDMEKKKVSIMIPCYNEEKMLFRLVMRLSK